MKLNAKELRDVDETEVSQSVKSIERKPIFLILESVYDTYNVGGLFRLADALAVKKIYLCGQTEIPPNPKIKKASIGTYKVVPWEYKKTAREAIEELRELHSTGSVSRQPKNLRNNIPLQPISIVAIEQDKKSVPYKKVEYQYPVAFIVGNETSGVTRETLDLVDKIVEIPMWGINKSLNVIVSAAIVSYWAVK